MVARYTEEISVKSARVFLRLHFDGVRVPWGSRCVWWGGVQYVTDQPGVYLVGASGGLEGVQIIKPASEQGLKAS